MNPDAQLRAAVLWYKEQPTIPAPEGRPGLWLWVLKTGEVEGIGTTPGEARDLAVSETLDMWEDNWREEGDGGGTAVDWVADVVLGGPIYIEGDPELLRAWVGASNTVTWVGRKLRAMTRGLSAA